MAIWVSRRRVLRKETIPSTQKLEGASLQPAQTHPQPLPQHFAYRVGVVDSPSPSFSTNSPFLPTLLSPPSTLETHPLRNIYASLDNDTTVIIPSGVQSTKSGAVCGSMEIVPLLPSLSAQKPYSWYRKRKFKILLLVFLLLVIGGAVGGVLGFMRLASTSSAHRQAVDTKTSSASLSPPTGEPMSTPVSTLKKTSSVSGGVHTTMTTMTGPGVNTTTGMQNATIQVSWLLTSMRNHLGMVSTSLASPTSSSNPSITIVTRTNPATTTTGPTPSTKTTPQSPIPIQSTNVPVETLTEGNTVVIVFAKTVTVN